jgi:hypothetical protein
LKQASSTGSDILESNRDELYKLYDFAINLEPKPEREELTFTQQQLVNRARTFVTMKMRKRANLREQKAESKSIIKMKHLLSEKIKDQQEDIIKAIQQDLAKKEENQTNPAKAVTEEAKVIESKPEKMVNEHGEKKKEKLKKVAVPEVVSPKGDKTKIEKKRAGSIESSPKQEKPKSPSKLSPPVSSEKPGTPTKSGA